MVKISNEENESKQLNLNVYSLNICRYCAAINICLRTPDSISYTWFLHCWKIKMKLRAYYLTTLNIACTIHCRTWTKYWIMEMTKTWRSKHQPKRHGLSSESCAEAAAAPVRELRANSGWTCEAHSWGRNWTTAASSQMHPPEAQFFCQLKK